jgi:thymidylate synthase (FAD)
VDRKIKVLDKGYVELIDWLGDDRRIIDSARVSYLSDKEYSFEEDVNLLKFIIEKNHTSPLEQVEFQFRIKSPLFVPRQWMRHRTFSYNEKSMRWSDAKREYYIPDSLRSDLDIEDEIKYEYVMQEYSFLMDDFYKELVDASVPKELARIILPVNLYTTFYAKVDLHNLFHFLELRRNEHAQYEIREYAHAIELLIMQIIPITFSIWQDKVIRN